MQPAEDSVYAQKVQLLPEYNIWVNRSKLHTYLKEAETQGEQGPVFILRRIMMLVFTIEEMANSRGQGIQHKSTENVDLMHREPLDPIKVAACKGEIFTKTTHKMAILYPHKLKLVVSQTSVEFVIFPIFYSFYTY